MGRTVPLMARVFLGMPVRLSTRAVPGVAPDIATPDGLTTRALRHCLHARHSRQRRGRHFVPLPVEIVHNPAGTDGSTPVPVQGISGRSLRADLTLSGRSSYCRNIQGVAIAARHPP